VERNSGFLNRLKNTAMNAPRFLSPSRESTRIQYPASHKKPLLQSAQIFFNCWQAWRKTSLTSCRGSFFNIPLSKPIFVGNSLALRSLRFSIVAKRAHLGSYIEPAKMKHFPEGTEWAGRASQTLMSTQLMNCLQVPFD
jgi:hypothetical protein